MTMNVWILVTVLLGTSAGHFLKRIIKRKEFSRSDMEVGNNFPGYKPQRETITIVKHCEPFINNKNGTENESHFELKTLLNKNDKDDTWLASKNLKGENQIRRLEWAFLIPAFILAIEIRISKWNMTQVVMQSIKSCDKSTLNYIIPHTFTVLHGYWRIISGTLHTCICSNVLEKLLYQWTSEDINTNTVESIEFVGANFRGLFKFYRFLGT